MKTRPFSAGVSLLYYYTKNINKRPASFKGKIGNVCTVLYVLPQKLLIPEILGRRILARFNRFQTTRYNPEILRSQKT